MGIATKIEWAHHTFNPWRGCARVSPGCTNCYAERGSKRNPAVLGTWGPAGRRAIGSDAYWRQPLSWNRAAEKAGERRRVFCASLADVFEDRPDLVEPRARLAYLIGRTPNLDWLLLTKRPENIARLWITDVVPPNVWLGTTTEDQQRADERVPRLLEVPARIHFLSVEPILGPIAFRREWMRGECGALPTVWHRRGLDWMIVGGESGPGARPCDVAWIRSVVAQCREAGVPCFVKQLGARVEDRNDAGFDGDEATGWPEGTETDIDPDDPIYQGEPCRILLDDPKGGDPGEWPEDLRVREVPA